MCGRACASVTVAAYWCIAWVRRCYIIPWWWVPISTLSMQFRLMCGSYGHCATDLHPASDTPTMENSFHAVQFYAAQRASQYMYISQISITRRQNRYILIFVYWRERELTLNRWNHILLFGTKNQNINFLRNCYDTWVGMWSHDSDLSRRKETLLETRNELHVQRLQFQEHTLAHYFYRSIRETMTTHFINCTLC